MPNPSPSQMELNAHLWLSLEHKTAELMAAQHTPPPGAEPLSREREIKGWWQRDESKDEASLWAAATTAHAEWIAQHPGVETDQDALRENWTEHMTKVRDLVYPNRAKLLKAGGRAVSVKEQVKYAERMAAHGPGEGGQDDGIAATVSPVDHDAGGGAVGGAEMGAGALAPSTLAAPTEEGPYGY